MLALLVVESALTIVLTKAQLDHDKVWLGFIYLVVIFTILVAVVTLLVIFCPKNLVYGKKEHSIPQVEPSALRDQIEDLIYENVKSECLKKPE